MGENRIDIDCYITADILTKVILEMFVEWSSTKHILFVLTSQFDWLSWQKAEFAKNIQASTHQKLYRGFYMSAPVLLNLLNELGEKMRGFVEHLIGFPQRV